MKNLLHLFYKPITEKINEISCKVLSKVKSQLSYPPLNLKRILEFGRNFHNGLYGSLPGFAVTKFCSI